MVSGEGVRTIEFARLPGGGRMASGAVSAKQASVEGRFCVTGGTLRGRPGKTTGVAFGTWQPGMRSGQGEGRFIVIELHV